MELFAKFVVGMALIGGFMAFWVMFVNLGMLIWMLYKEKRDEGAEDESSKST